MRSRLSALLGASILLSCLGGGSVATAAGSEGSQRIDPAVFRALTDMQLDAAIQEFAALRTRFAGHAPVGPSVMECRRLRPSDDVETCVVRAIRPTHAVPAAMAQR
jgi:hypothetical protein